MTKCAGKFTPTAKVEVVAVLYCILDWKYRFKQTNVYETLLQITLICLFENILSIWERSAGSKPATFKRLILEKVMQSEALYTNHDESQYLYWWTLTVSFLWTLLHLQQKYRFNRKVSFVYRRLIALQLKYLNVLICFLSIIFKIVSQDCSADFRVEQN
jgi:hypothetical protein